MHSRTSFSLVLLASLATGCVSRGKYDAALSDAARERATSSAERERLDRRLTGTEAELGRLKRYIAEAEARCRRTEAEAKEMNASAFACSKALDEATAINASLRSELERLGKDVDQLLATRGTLASSLEQAQARLDELRRAEAASVARAALFRDVALRLKRMIDAGELRIVLRSGRMVLVMPNDVLFDSGKTEIKPRGKEALGELAAVLKTLDKRAFQVAGHTDTQPIRFSGFASNWELSSERALRVVDLLLKFGMSPTSLSAAGYAEFDPLQLNDSPEHMAQNRRIEITLQPNIDEFVTVPDVR
jgi:chemotaxis protein MotB